MDKAVFEISAPYQPEGDQPRAIAEIVKSLGDGNKHHVLLGVTGSGKTFTMANVIAQLGRPTLIVAPNKTLAAQLFAEMREIFPKSSVEFFISYYDYYQPEAYIPSSDTYIAKDAAINDDIDKMRHAATQALFERRDVIIVASVSCIYGMGSPESYAKLLVSVTRGDEIARNDFLRKLIDIQYTRNDMALVRGNFRVRGDVVDILPANQKDQGIRVEFWGDTIESIALIDALTGLEVRRLDAVSIYPNSHYVTEKGDMKAMVREILSDLGTRLREFRAANKLVEYQRLEQRTMHDVELLEQLGYCPGIENYSRYLTGLPAGHPPPTLIDYFPPDFVTIIDESHITVPQIGSMFRGDRARKSNLVEYGFRLPAALDNRPLNFEEFLARTPTILHVSATPGVFERNAAGPNYSEQVIRPTGLVDPQIEVRPAANQVDDLYSEILATVKEKGRVLVTTLTKRMAEDLTSYYSDLGMKVRYLHSDIDSIQRVELLRDLRLGAYDVLVGINLLREGLDLPEVRLVAVMDADKEGFLRSKSSLIQTVGRASRNVQGRVLFYGDRMTDSMRACIDETDRRRAIQVAYNKERGIEPQSILKKMLPGLRELYGLSDDNDSKASKPKTRLLKDLKIKSTEDLDKVIRKKTQEMKKAASALNFEKAAEIRDTIAALRDLYLSFGPDEGAPEV